MGWASRPTASFSITPTPARELRQHLRDEVRRAGPGPAAGPRETLGRHLHQVADLGQAAVDLLGLLAAEIEHQPVDAEVGVALHRVGAERDRRRDDDLE